MKQRGLRLFGFVEVFVGQGVGGVFSFPVDGKDPPAATVIQKLKTIDAAGEGLLPFGVTGFVGATGMSDVIPVFNAVGNGALEKAFFRKIVASPLNVVVNGQGIRRDFSFIVATAGDEPGAGIKQRAEAVPIARTCDAGDRVVNRRKDVLDAVNIFGLRGWGAGV